MIVLNIIHHNGLITRLSDELINHPEHFIYYPALGAITLQQSLADALTGRASRDFGSVKVFIDNTWQVPVNWHGNFELLEITDQQWQAPRMLGQGIVRLVEQRADDVTLGLQVRPRDSTAPVLNFAKGHVGNRIPEVYGIVKNYPLPLLSSRSYIDHAAASNSANNKINLASSHSGHNILVGQSITIISGPAQGDTREIIAKSGGIITVDSDWQTKPTAASVYKIDLDYQYGIANAVSITRVRDDDGAITGAQISVQNNRVTLDIQPKGSVIADIAQPQRRIGAVLLARLTNQHPTTVGNVLSAVSTQVVLASGSREQEFSGSQITVANDEHQQTRTISSYDGATRTASLSSALSNEFNAGDVFEIAHATQAEPYDLSEINVNGFADIDARFPYDVGVVVAAANTVNELLSAISCSLVTRDGQLHALLLDVPTGPAVQTIDAGLIDEDYQIIPRPVVWHVVVRYGYQPNTQRWQQIALSNQNVLDEYSDAGHRIIDTPFISASAARAIAARVMELHGTARFIVSINYFGPLQQIELGAVITFIEAAQWPSGVLATIVGITTNTENTGAGLQLWI